MSLDVFAPAIAASDQNVAANAAANLPAGFGESFDIAWRSGIEFHNSAAYSIARERALVDYNDDVFQKTGERLPYVGYGDGDVSLDGFNEAQARLKEKVPGLDYLTPLSEGDINAMTLRRMARARSDAAAFQNRETSWGGTAGTVAGTLAGGLADPVMLATAPLGGAGEAGIALRALEFAAISGGSEAISAGLGYKSREAAVPGSAKEIPGEIAGATLSGALFGGAFGALGKVLGWGAKPLPTTVRDEVNAAASEFQFHATNPFPTAAGETAARDATVEAATSLAKGETVRAADNFDIGHVNDYAASLSEPAPGYVRLYRGEHPNRNEVNGGYFSTEKDMASTFGNLRYVDMPAEDAKFFKMPGMGEIYHLTDYEAGPSKVNWRSHVADYALAAKADTPEKLALAGEAHLRPETIAERPDVEAFDRMPSETDDAASYWDKRLEGASAEEKQELGATDGGRSASGLMLEHAEDIPFPAIPGVRDEASFARRFNINDADGNKVGVVDIQTKDNGKTLEIVHIGTEGGSSDRLNLGPRGVREVLNEVREQYPDAETLTGYRISGAHKGETKDVVFPLQSRDRIPANDLTPEQVTHLAAEPATSDAVLHNFEHIAAANPDMEFTTQVRQPDGSYQFVTQKLSDVLKDLDGWETAAKEIEACAVGGALEAAE